MSQASETKYWVGCVDDDQPFLESAGRLVRSTVQRWDSPVSCEVELAAGADEFSELMQEMDGEGAELALLITDQIMPQRSGLELIQEVKREHPATSCVLLTGYAGLESARFAINNRLLDRYVCKPIEEMEDFSELVCSELERFHLRRLEVIQGAKINRQAEELRIANERLERMKGVAEHVAYFSRELRTLDLDEVLDLVSDKVPSLFGAKSCFLFVPDRNNRPSLWRQRRVRCMAPVPPSLDINNLLRRAMTTRSPTVALERDWCSGSPDETSNHEGCVVMPLKLSHLDPAFTEDEAVMPALLCLCGIENAEDFSNDELEYKVLLINDILGANIANAMAYSETERLASEDSLTGAKTRRAFEELLRGEWERYQRYHSTFCVALMDVDHLKHINDAHGHAAGDEVLSKIAKVAKESSRCCDVLARYGGDEFCMLLPETGVEGAGHVIQRVKDRIAATTLMHMDEPASVSVGVAGVAGKRSPDEVLAAADRALYESKRAGRGQMCVEPEPVRESGQ